MIVFSGKDFRNIKNEKSITFSMENLGFSNTIGSGCFGFSGALNKSFNFKFIKGNLEDSNGRVFYNYDENGAFDFSGNVNESSYDYYIDSIAYSRNSNRSNYTIQNFFVECSGTNMSGDINIYTKESRKLSFTLPPRFSVSGTVTGTITNSSLDYSLDIFSGYTQLDEQSFTLESITNAGHLRPNSTIKYVLKNNTGEAGIVYPIDLIFPTSAGDIRVFKTSIGRADKPFENSSLQTLSPLFSSGESSETYDSGSFYFNNEKRTATGSGVVGDYYRLFLKYDRGYTGLTSGWTGAFTMSNAGAGYSDQSFNVTGGHGVGGHGFVLSDRNGVPSGRLTGISIDSLGKNYSGQPIMKINPTLGVTGETLAAGVGASITVDRHGYYKKFWNVWDLYSGASPTELLPVTGEDRLNEAYTGKFQSNQNFYIGVRSRNYYDDLVQVADLIVSGVSNGKVFTEKITGVL